MSDDATLPSNPTPKPRVLVPPRPNLGPEPWAEPEGAWVGTFSSLALGVGAVALTLVLRRRWRKQRIRNRVDDVSQTDAEGEADAWVTASGEARTALVRWLGPAWRSRTTEEIEADLILQERLGPDRLAELVHLFRLADRAKFADPTICLEATAQAAPPDVAILLQSLAEAVSRESTTAKSARKS